MLLRTPYSYRAMQRVTRPDGVRHYVCPDSGEHLPSVTTLLSLTADQSGLREWRERVGDKKADQTRDEALGLGTLMHTHLEAYVLGQARPRGNNLIRVQAERMADCIIAQGLCDVGEVWGSEVALHYPGLYAGTTDLVCLFRNRPSIVDFKTTKKMKTRSQIEDYFLQLSAYKAAHDAVYGTDIESLAIFMVSRDLQFQCFELSGDDIHRYTDKWLDRLEHYYAGLSAIRA